MINNLLRKQYVTLDQLERDKAEEMQTFKVKATKNKFNQV